MASNPTLTTRLIRGDLSLIFYFSLFKLLLHLVVNATGGYGIFRDEYYYVACANNLAAGYVDQPPLSAVILRGVIVLFGDSLFAIRFLSAVAAAVTVFFTGLIARHLGGGKLAVLLACLLSFSPINLAMAGYYSMNAFDILAWTIVAYYIVRIVGEERNKLWITLGAVLGLGLLNKIGVLFLGAGIFAGLLATPHRKWLTTPWPYLCGVIAFIFFLPYVIWNFQNSLAHLEFIKNATMEKYASQTALTFLSGQLLINNPVAIFVWLPGLIALFTFHPLKRYSMLGWMYLTALLILLVNGSSKPEYLAAAYGMLYAAGAVWWERIIQARNLIRYALAAVVIVYVVLALILTPMVLPVLSVERYITYADALGFKPASSEGKEQSELPQFYADMFGWKEKAESVARIYHSLPEEDKKHCAIFATNYGRCASLDYYGEELGIPKTIGNHNNYWIWGTRGYSGNVMLILGGTIDDHDPDFDEVTPVGVLDCNYCMPYEDNIPVFLCKGIKGSLNEIWPAEKHFE